DAMQCGTPSVTTSIGAEGLQGQGGWPGATADEIGLFVDAAADLYESLDVWQSAQKACAVTLQQFYSGPLTLLLIEKLQNTAAALDTHRRRNFIGAMLQHHQHKSTQYMGLWIEIGRASC